MTRIGSISCRVVGLIVFWVSLGALTSSSANAACAFWDLSGTWTLHQGNNIDVALTLQQSPLDTGTPGKIRNGTARYGTVVGRSRMAK